jgi:hypothetical protein
LDTDSCPFCVFAARERRIRPLILSKLVFFSGMSLRICSKEFLTQVVEEAKSKNEILVFQQIKVLVTEELAGRAACEM